MPIVMVTSRASEDDQGLAFAALEAGVLAFVPKPAPGVSSRLGADELVRTIKSMAQVKVVRRWAPGRRPRRAAVPGVPGTDQRLSQSPAVVAIGAPTGGPQALREILTRLPATLPLPVLVVQHIAEGFAPGLVDWLRPLCQLPIQLAAPGAALDHPAIH